ncbi:MAG: 50S ribosomal protein L31 [Minisyncoccales bacterium]
MKKGIHPAYYPKAKIKCNSCQSIFEIGSTKEYMEVEICSRCHPFFTGKENIVDTIGKIEKYKKKLEKTKELQAKKGNKKKE